LAASAHPTPKRSTHHQWLNPILPNTDESAMVLDSAVPEQPRQKRKRVISQRLVDERFLPFQCFYRTATRNSIIVQGFLHDLREKFRCRAKTFG
jgi:hypothetical protein